MSILTLTNSLRPGLTTVLDFGKYKGMALRAIIDLDAEYVQWLTSPDGGDRPINNEAYEYMCLQYVGQQLQACELNPRNFEDDLPF